MTATLLIVWHSRTGATKQMVDSIEQGARDAAESMDCGESLRLIALPARRTMASDLISADGYLFCAPENLASVSGEMKEFFDRCYYDVLDSIAGRPYALAVSAGSDGSGAARQMARIATGWRLKAIAEPLIIGSGAQTREAILAPKQIDSAAHAASRDLGGLIAATLLLAA
jgi:NAD(P)H-dependent FMN reductase